MEDRCGPDAVNFYFIIGLRVIHVFIWINCWVIRLEHEQTDIHTNRRTDRQTNRKTAWLKAQTRLGRLSASLNREKRKKKEENED